MDRKYSGLCHPGLWRFWNARFDDVDKKQRGIAYWHVCSGPCISVSGVSQWDTLPDPLRMDRKYSGVCCSKVQHSRNTRFDDMGNHDPCRKWWHMCPCARIQICGVCRRAQVSMDCVWINIGFV
jgi:hypothetical protein